MLVAAALCPNPPMLLPGLTGAVDVAADLRARCVEVVRGLVETSPDVVVVVGGADRAGRWPEDSQPDPSPYRGRAVDGPGHRRAPEPGHGAGPAAEGPSLPLSLSVGVLLLDLAGWSGRRELTAVHGGAGVQECLSLGRDLTRRAGERTALLVLGDASACRGPRSPGYLDVRAVPFDDAVVRAMDEADASALAAIDPVVADELLAQGRAAWQVLAGAMPGGSSGTPDGGAVPPADGPASSDGGTARWHGGVVHTEDPLGVLYVLAAWRVSG